MEMIKVEITVLLDANEYSQLLSCYNMLSERGYSGDVRELASSLLAINARANILERADLIMKSLK